MLSSRTWAITDVDQLRTAIRPEGEVIVTANERIAADITRIDLHRLGMQRVGGSPSQLVWASISVDRGCFCFLTGSGRGIVVNGVEARPGDISSLPPGRDFTHRVSDPPHWGAVSLPPEDLAELGAAYAGRDLTPPPGALPITPPPTAMVKFLRLHSAAEHLAKYTPEIIAHPDAARGLEQAIVGSLVACISEPDVQNDRVSHHRHAAIMRQFYDTVEERGDEAAYVAEICMAMGVAHKTLRLCCQKYLGMGPKQFLVRRRMHLAYRALRQGDAAKTSVTDIASRFGFWEFGRFAVAYKSIFGKSPSVTLRHSCP